jgi:hypothetical protein
MPGRFGRIITPVYKQVGDSHLDHLGTAVLVRANNSFWLLSAAHVLRDHQKGLWLCGRPKTFQLTGTLVWGDDPLDLAFTELTKTEHQALIDVGNDFLWVENVDATAGDFGDTQMIVSGFPESRVVIDGDERSILATPTNLRSKFLSNAELRVRRYDPTIRLAGSYDVLVDNDGHSVKKLSMRGLSGGAIWCRNDSNELKLVGIAIEYDSKRKLLVGTRIRPLIAAIARRIEGRLQQGS